LRAVMVLELTTWLDQRS